MDFCRLETPEYRDVKQRSFKDTRYVNVIAFLRGLHVALV